MGSMTVTVQTQLEPKSRPLWGKNSMGLSEIC